MATTAIGIRAARELDELYRAHAAEVYRYVYAVLGNSADAEDVTQTTFVNALRALERGERPRKPTNWLITIAHNLIRQRFRQQQARPHEVELDRELASFESDDDGPSIDDLVRALQRIPPSQREALVLRELEGRSYKEIVSILDISPTALETLIFRARRSLAEELENLVTCDRAQLALSHETDGRLGRKERKRLVAHLEECPSCTRFAAIGMKRRHAFKSLALLPLPLSLMLFKGAPSASAAVGLPAIGAGTLGVGTLGVGTVGVGALGGGAAVGGGAVASGVAAKVALALVAVTVAGGAGYEGVQQIRQPAEPMKPAKAVPVKAGHAKNGQGKAVYKTVPGALGRAAKRARTPVPTGRPAGPRSTEAKQPGNNGRSAEAPGLERALGKTKRPPQLKTHSPQTTPSPQTERGKSSVARLRPRPAARPFLEPVTTKQLRPDESRRESRPLAPPGRSSKPSK